jgi:hypothetical protein
MTPAKSNAPKRINPSEKDPSSPMSPIPAGMAPAPRRMPREEVKEMAIFFILGDPIRERAANPAGKKQVAIIG